MHLESSGRLPGKNEAAGGASAAGATGDLRHKAPNRSEFGELATCVQPSQEKGY
jgi:hypothetical protein